MAENASELTSLKYSSGNMVLKSRETALCERGICPNTWAQSYDDKTMDNDGLISGYDGARLIDQAWMVLQVKAP